MRALVRWQHSTRSRNLHTKRLRDARPLPAAVPKPQLLPPYRAQQRGHPPGSLRDWPGFPLVYFRITAPECCGYQQQMLRPYDGATARGFDPVSAVRLG